MAYQIKKAAVIGSGTMGGGIASLLAGVGIETLLLDIPPAGSAPEDGPRTRNSVVASNLKALQKMRPAQLYSTDDLRNISIGNIEDDLGRVGDADWVIEVIVEKLEIKRALMARLAEVVKPDAIITTNTSGIPISSIAEGLPLDFTRRFLGTHFFNPPRYLRLLEIIPHAGTDPDDCRLYAALRRRCAGQRHCALQRHAQFHRQSLHVHVRHAGDKLRAGSWLYD